MSEYRSTPTAELHHDGISSKRAEPTNTIGCDLYNQPFLTKKRGERKKGNERTNEGNRTSKAKSVRQTEGKRESVNIETEQRSFFGCDLVAGEERKKKACFSLASSYFSRFSFFFIFWCVCVRHLVLIISNRKFKRHSVGSICAHHHNWVGGGGNRQQENGQKNKIRRAR